MITNRIEFDVVMSNEELAAAIDRAKESAGDATELQKVWQKHLVRLLNIQAKRASVVKYVEVHDD